MCSSVRYMSRAWFGPSHRCIWLGFAAPVSPHAPCSPYACAARGRCARRPASTQSECPHTRSAHISTPSPPHASATPLDSLCETWCGFLLKKSMRRPLCGGPAQRARCAGPARRFGRGRSQWPGPAPGPRMPHPGSQQSGPPRRVSGRGAAARSRGARALQIYAPPYYRRTKYANASRGIAPGLTQHARHGRDGRRPVCHGRLYAVGALYCAKPQTNRCSGA